MRSSYYAMLVVIAAAMAAVVGSLVVFGGYLLGRLARRGTPRQISSSDHDPASSGQSVSADRGRELRP